MDFELLTSVLVDNAKTATEIAPTTSPRFLLTEFPTKICENFSF